MDTKRLNKEIVIYQSADGTPRIEVRIENDSVWLTQDQMATLFDKAKSTINEHIKNIFTERELDKGLAIRKFRTTTKHGAMKGKTQASEVNLYNLDVIISVGYRVKSIRGTQFRQWATARLREYIIKGFTINDDRLKGAGGGNYWKELLERIRDIRSSEKALYRQVLDLYATSVDYDSNSQESIAFFKTVQNKLHYATNQQTAAELIYSRADATKDFMGMSTFRSSQPIKSDVDVAKNYRTKDELFRLNRLVSAFFDLAEIKAQDHKQMRMKDWIVELDTFSGIYGKGVLKNSGKISHKQATNKAIEEYRKYQIKTLSPVEKAYLNTIKSLQKKVNKFRSPRE